jgi:hypothetical protein
MNGRIVNRPPEGASGEAEAWDAGSGPTCPSR